MSQEYIVELCRAWVESGLALLLQTAVVMLLGLGLGRALRRSGPGAQSVAYRATMAAVVCTGLLSFMFASHLHPLWRVTLPQPSREVVAMSGGTSAPVTLTPLPAQRPVSPAVETAPPAVSTPTVSPAATLPSAPPPLPAVSQLYVAAFLAWWAGTLGLLAWFGIGQWTLFRLRRASVPITPDPAWKIRHPLSLRASAHIRSPFLAGVRQPTIYLPASYAQDFDTAELRAILAHETAHRERRDVAWTLLARLTCALLWPQPLLWFLTRRMEQAAEESCDSLAVTQGCSPRAYADCLLSLAERLTPSRTERSLGLGVVPFRSQVGQRIQQILSKARYPRTISRRLRFGIVVAALAAAASGLLLIAGSRPPRVEASAEAADKPQVWAAPAGYLANFTAAQHLGGSVGTITLLSSFDKTVRYPTVLTDEEKSLIKQCKKSGVYNTDYGSGGPPLHDRRELESILAKHPHFFVAEYLVGTWYRQTHDLKNAALWMERALQDAPAIIAGRVQFADGRPVNGYTFTPSVALYQSANGTDDHADYYDPQQFQYPETTTDAQGCYYLPVFRAVYDQPWWGGFTGSPQTTAARLAAHMDVTQPQTGKGSVGRFTFTTRVGVLPPMVARPYLLLIGPFGAGHQKQDDPLRLSGSDLNITWGPYPGAAKYEAQVEEIVHSHNSTTYTNLFFMGGDDHFHRAMPTNYLHLSLSGTVPGLVRTRTYILTITARSAGGDQLADSHQYFFQPLSGIAPQPLTKAGLTKLLPSGFVIDSVFKTAQGGIITGSYPSDSNLDLLTERNICGWKSADTEIKPLYLSGRYAQRNRFRLVYRMTGNVPSGSASFAAGKASAQSPPDALCAAHLTQIGRAIIRYMTDHHQHFPDADRWVDEIMPYVKDVTVFHDPIALASQKYGYAFNRNLSGLSDSLLKSPATVVAVFESIKSTRNASDMGQSLPYPQSFAGAEFLFADGHVKRVKPDQSLFFITDTRPKQKVPQTPIVVQPPATVPKAEAVTMVGRVVFANGKPAPGVLVDAQLSDTPHDTAHWRDAVDGATGATDTNGRYVLTGLSNNHYNVMAEEATGQWVAVAARDVIGKQGATVTVPDRVLTHGAWIVGKVTDAKTGQPLRGIEIGSYGPARPDTSAAILLSSPTGSDGRYKLCVAAGRNEVYVCQPQAATGNYAEPGQSIRYVTIKSGETKVVPFRLAKAAPPQAAAQTPAATTPANGTIIGRIVYADGRPAAGVTVVARMETRSAGAYLSRYEPSVINGNADRVGTVSQADGSYRLSKLLPAYYDIVEYEASGKWVAAARTGIHTDADVPVRVPDLVLTHGAVMTGIVTDKRTGKPIPGAYVYSLGPRYPATMLGASETRADSLGRYILRLAPGDNWIYVSGGYEVSTINIDPVNDGNPKYPGYAHGFHIMLREGETKVVPINAVRAPTGSN